MMPVTLAEIAQAEREYHPCDDGLHVCGQICDEMGDRPLTLGNVPGVDGQKFEALRAQYATPDDDFDIVIDRMVGGDIVDDFGMRRQDLAALLKDASQL